MLKALNIKACHRLLILYYFLGDLATDKSKKFGYWRRNGSSEG